jgi:citrate synthase
MSDPPMPISTTEGDEIVVRGHRLSGDLLGRVTFTEMFLLDMDGTPADTHKVRMVDAVLVALMEHGITPSTLAARLVLDGAPESTQGAVAAGLLAVGSRFLGTVEQAADMLQRIVSTTVTPSEDAARREVRRILESGERIPGLGHNLHSRVDPRVDVLIRIAEEEGLRGAHIDALKTVREVAERESGRALIVNAAGAIGAILSDMGYPPSKMRGFALVARAAGVVAHVVDEQAHPMAREVWVKAHDQQTRE